MKKITADNLIKFVKSIKSKDFTTGVYEDEHDTSKRCFVGHYAKYKKLGFENANHKLTKWSIPIFEKIGIFFAGIISLNDGELYGNVGSEINKYFPQKTVKGRLLAFLNQAKKLGY